MRHLMTATIATVTLALFAGCTKDGAPNSATSDVLPSAEAPVPITNRIDIPLAVRQNLGITFAKVERRPVASTLRYPGRFELDPAATRSFAIGIGGEVTAHVAANSRVKSGELLATVVSPEGAELAERIADANASVSEALADVSQAEAAIREAESESTIASKRGETLAVELKAIETRSAALDASIRFWSSRIEELKDTKSKGGAVADAIAEAEGKRLEVKVSLSELAKDDADLKTRSRSIELDQESAQFKVTVAKSALENFQAKHKASISRRDAALAHAAATMRLDKLAPDQPISGSIEIRADRDGVVTESAVTGQWVEAGGNIVTVVNPKALRMRFRIPVSDFAKLTGVNLGKIARVDFGQDEKGDENATAKLQVLDAAPSDPGVLDAFLIPEHPPAWALAGMVARAEIAIAGGTPRISIPVRATIRDGLDILAFVRDSKNPDKVIRQPVTLGPSDGIWVVVDTGVGPDDEVVLDGIYELKLTGAGKAAAGGHFHADGTFHEGAH